MVSAKTGLPVLCAVAAAFAVVVSAAPDARRLPPGPGVLPPVSASDVVLFIAQEACPSRDNVAEIAVAQQEMSLADVLVALRLEAAHRGANGVMDIRVSVVGDAEGEKRFRVSGQAVRCRDDVMKAPNMKEPGPRPRR